jgi:hypothetical protein
MLAQVLERGVGVEVALEVSVVAVGDGVGVGVLGACELGDGFACGGDEFGACELLEGAVGFGSCGVEGCGADEVLEVVYWVCVVVLPIGLSHLVMFDFDHSGDRDTRWVFCYTNCAAKVRECTGLESPLTPTLSPFDKGGEGREWGDSARAGICELWLGDWYYSRGRGAGMLRMANVGE